MPNEDRIIYIWVSTCFFAGTPILMSDGQYKNIEMIEPGEQIFAYNEETQENEVKTVLATLTNDKLTKFATLTFEDGSTLDLTESHNLYSTDREEWIPAKDFAIGEKVKTYAGASAITNIKLYEKENVTVYNLTIEDLHNYYAGEQSILAHNVVTA